MRLSRQFQACLYFFAKRFCVLKKYQNAKQATFTLLENCARKKLLPCLFSVCFILFCSLMLACMFLCARNLFLKKINRLEIVLITSFYYTAKLTMLLLICTLSRREKPNDYKIVERKKLNDYKIVRGKNLTTTLRNRLHQFMAIFCNLINQGVTSHSEIKT